MKDNMGDLKTKYFFFPYSKGGKFQKPGKTYVDFAFDWL